MLLIDAVWEKVLIKVHSKPFADIPLPQDVSYLLQCSINFVFDYVTPPYSYYLMLRRLRS